VPHEEGDNQLGQLVPQGALRGPAPEVLLEDSALVGQWFERVEHASVVQVLYLLLKELGGLLEDDIRRLRVELSGQFCPR
jgi:hypothetical protein